MAVCCYRLQWPDEADVCVCVSICACVNGKRCLLGDMKKER